MTGAKRSAWFALFLVSGLAVFAYFVFRSRESLSALEGVSTGGVLAYCASHVLSRLASSESIRLSLAGIGHRVRSRETFVGAMLHAYANLFVPGAGVAAPAVLLRKVRDVPYSDTASVYFFLGFIQLACASGTGLLAALFLGAGPAPTVLFTGLLAAAITALLLARVELRSPPGKFLRALAGVQSVVGRIQRDGRLVSRALALQLVALCLRVARLALCFSWVGSGLEGLLGLLQVALISALGDFALILQVTPSGLGTKELAMAAGASMAGVGLEQVAAAAVLDRVVSTLLTVALGQTGPLAFSSRSSSAGS